MHQLVLFSYFLFKLVALKICLRLKRDCPIRFQTMGIIQTVLKQWSFLNFHLNYFISQGPIVFQNKVNNTTLYSLDHIQLLGSYTLKPIILNLQKLDMYFISPCKQTLY